MPSALLGKQDALCVCRDFLLRCRDSVHVTQAISQRLHHVRGKVWRLLNEKMEPPPVDFRQPTGGFRHGACRARAVIDQRHFTNQRAWPCRLEHEIAQQDFHFPFQQYVRLFATVAFTKKKIAGRELQRGGFVTKSSAGFMSAR